MPQISRGLGKTGLSDTEYTLYGPVTLIDYRAVTARPLIRELQTAIGKRWVLAPKTSWRTNTTRRLSAIA
jgi:hypothetical protein